MHSPGVVFHGSARYGKKSASSAPAFSQARRGPTHIGHSLRWPRVGQFRRHQWAAVSQATKRKCPTSIACGGPRDASRSTLTTSNPSCGQEDVKAVRRSRFVCRTKPAPGAPLRCVPHISGQTHAGWRSRVSNPCAVSFFRLKSHKKTGIEQIKRWLDALFLVK